jgi:hypothetical protein
MAGRVVSRRRARTTSTPVHESLGRALGRCALADPSFRDALLAGFTDAYRAHALGRPAPSAAAAVAELAAATDALASLAETPAPGPRRKR